MYYGIKDRKGIVLLTKGKGYAKNRIHNKNAETFIKTSVFVPSSCKFLMKGV